MWFFSAKKQRPAKPPRRPATFRPTVNALEDRFLLSASPLDPTFGTGGIVTTQMAKYGSDAYAVALQADGKILAAGTAVTSNSNGNVFALARYTTNGSLDATFGSGGKVTTKVGKGTAAAEAGAMAVYPNAGTANDGKIVLAGDQDTSGSAAVDVARYNTNGTLDTSFGSGGTVSTTVASNSFIHTAGVAIQSDGKMVVTATTWPTSGSPQIIVLVRYNASGTLDTTFGNGGIVTSNLGVSSTPRAVALQVDGKINVAATIVTSSGGTSQALFAVARYNANGTLDTAFGNGTGYAAFVVSNIGSIAYGAYGLAIQPADGKIVAVGEEQSGYDAAVARFNTDGSPDTAFGGTGLVAVAFQGLLNTVALQTDGKIVAAGQYGNINNSSIELARLNSDGSPDTTFNGTGLVNTQIGTSADAFGVAIQPADSKIVVAGASPWNSRSSDTFLVARYVATDPTIGSFTASANPVTSGSSETFTVSNIADSNPGATITEVAFYYFDSTGTQQVLGYGTQTSPGVWTLTFTVTLAPGSYTISAQAEDNDGLFSNPLAATLTVQ